MEKEIKHDKVYYFINGHNNKVIGWSGWFPTNTPDVYCNGWGWRLTRNIKELYETESEALGNLKSITQ